MNAMILLPTYNERDNVRVLLPKIFSLLPAIRVMVIDDGSPDGTADEVKQMQTKYPNLLLYERQKKEGLGRAYTDAFKKVLTEFPETEAVCTMDADMSHDYEALPAILEKTNNYDVVIGSRYVAGGKLEGWEWHRKLLSALGNRYVRLVTKLPLHDCTSGFNCIRTDTLRRLDFSDIDPSGYAFLIYLKYKLWKLGARIAEYPITFRSRLNGESKISMNIIEEGLLLPWKLIRKKTGSTGSCPICQNVSQYWFTKNNCRLHRCQNCALIFMHPQPEGTDALYSEDYFCGARDGYGYIDYDADKQHDTKIFENYLKQIALYASGGRRLLDVGAATGSFLAIARQHGWGVAGVEISPYAAEVGRKKGLEMHTGDVATAPLNKSSFDVITLWDVFEHVSDPKKTLNRLYDLLQPGGILVLNLPNAGSFYARAMGKHWQLIIPPEHLHLFNKTNLSKLLTNHNFKPILFTKIGKSFTPAYIFQILYTMRRKLFWKKLSDRVRTTPLNKLSVPIHLRDNMFVIARKV